MSPISAGCWGLSWAVPKRVTRLLTWQLTSNRECPNQGRQKLQIQTRGPAASLRVPCPQAACDLDRTPHTLRERVPPGPPRSGASGSTPTVSYSNYRCAV